LAEELEIGSFKASDYWLENFKERHGIKFQTEQGEAAAVDQEVVLLNIFGQKHSILRTIRFCVPLDIAYSLAGPNGVRNIESRL
jgi:hypothetical protein